MENLIFSLNATIPVFLTMLLGMLFRKTGLFGETFAQSLNKFVFKAALPALLFQDIATADFYQVWDTRFVVFCFAATFLSICLAGALSLSMKDRNRRGEFIQTSYRSSAAILGIAFIQNIYGNAGMAPLMIISSVPLYNVMAVIVLSVTSPKADPAIQQAHGGAYPPASRHFGMNWLLLRKTFLGILTNPIILGILTGLLWSVLRLPMPGILMKPLSYLAVLATPLGLMSMGASFNLKKALTGIRPVLLSCALKLVVLAALFLPAAVSLGFRDSSLIAILVMLGSPTTVTCYIMAKNMGHEGTFSSMAIMLTTLLSAFTLTGWLYLLRTLSFI